MTPTVLVVEDNEALADNIAELFDDVGAKVQVRTTADAALEYARKNGFDLAVVDIGLPGGQDGLALVPELRDLTPDGEVILVTGNASLDSTIAAVRHGAFAYVLKPFDPDELLSIGERALAQVGLRRERGQLARELASSEALHRGVVDTVEAAIVGLDAAGYIRMVNRFALDTSGFSSEEMEGQPFADFGYGERTRESLEADVRAALGGHILRERQLPMKTRSGETRVIRWTFTPLQVDGSARGDVVMVVVGLDVTERLELERQKAENEAMATLGRLTTGLAHEIRNPLNAAKLQLELLGRSARKLGDDKIGERAEIVRLELARLSAMLEDFLRLARPQGIEERPVDIDELMREVAALQEPLAEDAGVELAVEPSEHVGEVLGDREKIKQILLNLVGNALEAMSGEPDGGRIALQAEPVDDGRIAVSVRDTGPGLPPDVAEHIFEPFTTTKDAGTGLGLALVNKLVEMHGGDVRLDSSPEGTVARFTLRRA